MTDAQLAEYRRRLQSQRAAVMAKAQRGPGTGAQALTYFGMADGLLAALTALDDVLKVQP